MPTADGISSVAIIRRTSCYTLLVSPLSMAKNEKTSPRVARIAARLMKRSKSRKVRTVSASALTQSADRSRESLSQAA